jgi:hypothetical protein
MGSAAGAPFGGSGASRLPGLAEGGGADRGGAAGVSAPAVGAGAVDAAAGPADATVASARGRSCKTSVTSALNLCANHAQTILYEWSHARQSIPTPSKQACGTGVNAQLEQVAEWTLVGLAFVKGHRQQFAGGRAVRRRFDNRCSERRVEVVGPLLRVSQRW